MYRIRFLKDMIFEETVTELVDGSLSVSTRSREVVFGKMLPAEQVVKDEDGYILVHFDENRRASFDASEVEVSQWEPDNTIPARHCCNHGG